MVVMTGGEVWTRFENDPRVPQHAHLRASDRDRDMVNQVLSEAYAEGRLTPEEHDERITRVARAKTLGELPPVVADLIANTTPVLWGRTPPAHLRAEAERIYRDRRRSALSGFLIPSLITLSIYLASGWGSSSLGFPWPLFVIVPTLANYLRTAQGREDHITAVQEKLQRREERVLRRRQALRFPMGPPLGGPPGRQAPNPWDPRRPHTG